MTSSMLVDFSVRQSALDSKLVLSSWYNLDYCLSLLSKESSSL